MKKIILSIAGLVVSGLCYGEFVSTLAENGARSATLTNPSSINPLWVTGMSVAQTSAATNTVELIVVKGGVDFRVGTIAMTADTAGSVQLTHPVRIAPGATLKVQRGTAATNQVVNIWVSTKTSE
jgi:hypothetical protein